MLPGPYERWFVEASGRASPVEARSTCEACAMAPGAPSLPPEGPFDPALRCCTFHPQLAPHFVGGILARGGDLGRAIVRARIAARAGVTPLGLLPSTEFAAAHAREGGLPGAFGRRAALRCPFLDEERCTIWEHRGAACAAFHCKLERGPVGGQLWNLVILAFTVIERGLARGLLAEHGLDAAACDALLRAPDDDALHARAWGALRGREEAYFTGADRRVEALGFADVERVGGRELRGLGDALRRAMDRYASRDLPSRVRRSDEDLFQIRAPGRAILVHAAAPLDPLELPAALADRLARLEESPLADLGVDEDLARRLLDWRAILPADPI